MDGSKITKIMLKYAVSCLGFGMLLLANCYLKISRLGATATLSGRAKASGKKEEGVFVHVVVLTSMTLTGRGQGHGGHFQFCRRGMQRWATEPQRFASSTETAV